MVRTTLGQGGFAALAAYALRISLLLCVTAHPRARRKQRRRPQAACNRCPIGLPTRCTTQHLGLLLAISQRLPETPESPREYLVHICDGQSRDRRNLSAREIPAEPQCEDLPLALSELG